MGGHVFQITAVALRGTIDTIFFAPTAYCTSITEEWIVSCLGLSIVTEPAKSGRIRIRRADNRILVR